MSTPDKRMTEMVDRFLSWKLPKSVRPDECVLNRDYPHRIGTNLLTADEARQMLEHVLGDLRDWDIRRWWKAAQETGAPIAHEDGWVLSAREHLSAVDTRHEACQRLGCRFPVAQDMLHRAQERGELTETEIQSVASASNARLTCEHGVVGYCEPCALRDPGEVGEPFSTTPKGD